MTKKEYLILLLNKLIPYWDQAKHMLDYVQQHDDEMYIHYLYIKFVDIVNGLLSSKNQNKAKQIVEKITSLQQKEALNKLSEQEQIDNLEQFISDL